MPNTKISQSDELLTYDKEKIRYGKCIGCPDIGTRCGAGNLLILPAPELISWLRAWRIHFKLSIKECADAWDTPYGTAVRILSGSDTEFKYTTLHHIIQHVVRYGLPADQVVSDNPCPATSSEIAKQQQELECRYKQKQFECDRLTEENREQQRSHRAEIEGKQRSIDFLRELAQKRQEDIDEKNRVMNLRRVEVAGLNDTIAALQSQRVDDMREADLRYDALLEEYKNYRKHSRRARALLSVIIVAVSIGFLCYWIWDMMHPGVGLFQY